MIVILSVIYMLIIHILYKIPSLCNFCIAEWTAGDLLSYGGSIVGAIATIYVLQETIHSTLKLQKRKEYFHLGHIFWLKQKNMMKTLNIIMK